MPSSRTSCSVDAIPMTEARCSPIPFSIPGPAEGTDSHPGRHQPASDRTVAIAVPAVGQPAVTPPHVISVSSTGEAATGAGRWTQVRRRAHRESRPPGSASTSQGGSIALTLARRAQPAEYLQRAPCAVDKSPPACCGALTVLRLHRIACSGNCLSIQGLTACGEPHADTDEASALPHAGLNSKLQQDSIGCGSVGSTAHGSGLVTVLL